jgi:hypothetical protein
MQQKKALIMTPTFFTERDYRESGCGAAIEGLIDDARIRDRRCLGRHHRWAVPLSARVEDVKFGRVADQVKSRGRSWPGGAPAR